MDRASDNMIIDATNALLEALLPLRALLPLAEVVQGTVTVGVTPTPLRVGAQNMVGRRKLRFQPTGAGFTWGYSQGSQTYAVANAEPVDLDVGPEITIWAKKGSGSGSFLVVELA